MRNFLALLLSLALAACGGSGSGGVPPGLLTISGTAQKGPYVIGSEVTVIDLDARLDVTGKVYSAETIDGVGSFAVTVPGDSTLVEIACDGYYYDELTGTTSTGTVRLRALVDVRVNPRPVVNLLTSMQAQRLRTLVARGSTFAAASLQSKREVLAALGIADSSIDSASDLSSMRIDGSSDADGVLLAASTILSQMAASAAASNGTHAAAELSLYVNLLASQIARTGTVTDPVFAQARSLAATQIDATAVRSQLESYYARYGATLAASSFEEWIDKDGSGVLPQRQRAIDGLSFPEAVDAEPKQVVTSAPFTIAGLGTGVTVPIRVTGDALLVKNDLVVAGPSSTAVDGDRIALRITAPGFKLSATASVQVGSTSALWKVTSRALGGQISGLASSGLVLQVNGIENVTVDKGSTQFAFAAPLENGMPYQVTVVARPTGPTQFCSVSGGEGTVGGRLTAIHVACNTQGSLVYAVPKEPGPPKAFGVDPVTGMLTEDPVAFRGLPDFYYALESPVVVHPSGKSVYIRWVRDGQSLLDRYQFDAAGGLVWLENVTVDTPFNIFDRSGIAFDPTGSFIYMGYTFFAGWKNATLTGRLRGFSIDASTGASSQIMQLSVDGGEPNKLVIDPSGQLAFTQLEMWDTVYAYRIDATTHQFLFLGASTTYPEAFTPLGTFAYTLDANAGSVIVSSVDVATGVLTPVTTSRTGAGPFAIALDPTGRFAYVVNSGDASISAFRVDATTGALTSLGPATPTAGPTPKAIGVDPNGRFAYVSGPFGLTVYRIDAATGRLTSIMTAPTGGAADWWISVRALP